MDVGKEAVDPRGIHRRGIGEDNKRKILGILEAAYPGGKSISELVNETRLDRSVVYGHLNSLIQDRIVVKVKVKGKKYRIEYRKTNRKPTIEGFASTMKPMGGKMIYPIWLTPQVIDGADRYPSSVYGLTRPDWQFYESMLKGGVTISSDYCRTTFNETERDEKYIFEFVNRFGAFAAYIFIESLKRDANSLVDIAIDLNGVFREFQNLFRIKESENGRPDEILKAFRKVYPTAGILERYWLYRVQLAETFEKDWGVRLRKEERERPKWKRAKI
jgi:DNA-binding HxlR family transcriptional regulator